MTATSFSTDPVQSTQDPTSIHPQDDNVEILKKRLKDKDDFIETLKGETKEFRDRITQLESQLQQAKTIDELLERVKDYEPSDASEPTAPRLDEDKLLSKLEERVFGKLSQRQKEDLETQNWNESVSKLQEKFGDKYLDYVRSRATELSVPIEEMDRLAKTSPKAFMELVSGQQQRSTTMQPTQSNQRTSSVNNNQGQQNEEYFDRINRLRFTQGPEGSEARKIYNSKEYQANWRKHILSKVQS